MSAITEERDVRDVLVVTPPGDIEDVILSAVAAQDLRAIVATDLDAVAARWSEAALVFVADECAEWVAQRALPRRDGVYVIGENESALAAWSAPLGARVIPLPDGVAWLGAVLDEGSSQSGAPVMAVMGGSGGVGASTLAAGIAMAAASRGTRAALVDVDALGGGLDLLMGVEQTGGWRWPKLRGADGYVGDLREYLPQVDGVSVLSMSRETATDLAREPLAAIVQSLRRSHGLVVVDVGRCPAAASREAVRLASCRLVVVAGGVRGLAAADQVIRAYQPESVEAVVRQRHGCGTGASVVAEVLGLPVVARLPDDPRLVAAADRGDPPFRGVRQPYARVCWSLASRTLGRVDRPVGGRHG